MNSPITSRALNAFRASILVSVGRRRRRRLLFRGAVLHRAEEGEFLQFRRRQTLEARLAAVLEELHAQHHARNGVGVRLLFFG